MDAPRTLLSGGKRNDSISTPAHRKRRISAFGCDAHGRVVVLLATPLLERGRLAPLRLSKAALVTRDDGTVTMRRIWWWLRFIGHAILQHDFEDTRVQRLVRQHFTEFWRG